MSFKARNYSGYAIAFLFGLTVMPGYQLLNSAQKKPEPLPLERIDGDSPIASERAANQLILAQSYSDICSTPEGECDLEYSDEIGASCWCVFDDGETEVEIEGRVVP